METTNFSMTNQIKPELCYKTINVYHPWFVEILLIINPWGWITVMKERGAGGTGLAIAN